MKPVSVSYWNEELKQMEVAILQQPDSIHTVAFSVSFQWMPSCIGSLPALKDYKLNTFVLYNIDLLEQQMDKGYRKFDVMDLLVTKIKNACFDKGVIVDPDHLQLLPAFGKDMEVEDER